MKMKKAVTFLWVLIMVVSMFAGCSKEVADSTDSDDTTGSSETSKDESSSTSETSGFKYTGAAPITDQEGQKITMLANNSWYSTVDFANAPIVQEVATRAGITVDWTLVSPTNYVDSVSPLLAAGTNLQDIVQLPNMDPNMSYIKAGLFLPLDDYMDEYMPNYKAFLEANPDIKASLTAEDGHIYYVPQTAVTDNYQPCIMINTMWLDQLGKEAPKTIDEFVEVLRAFKEQDMNGNGDATDEIPMSVQANFLPYMFGPAFGLDLVSGFYADDQGKVHYAYYETENYKNYVTFLNGLYNEGLLEIEYITLTRDQITERCAQNLTGVTFDYSWQQSQLYSPQYPEYDGTAPIMVGIPPLSGEYEGFYVARNPISNIFGVSSSSSNKELAIKFLDYAMSEESQELYVWGIEGESYTIAADGTKAFTEKASDGQWLQALGINPGCLPSQQSVPATDVLLPAWHSAVDKEVSQFMRAPWPFIYATSDEANIVSQYLVDITTFVEEKNVAFITGTASLDSFDEFIEDLKSMNIEELIKIRQTQYDRFMSAK